MFKENDIIIYNGIVSGVRLIYVTGVISYSNYSIIVVASGIHSKKNRVDLGYLNNLGLIKMIENRKILDTEIMNLADTYAEYLI